MIAYFDFSSFGPCISILHNLTPLGLSYARLKILYE